jgi:3-keto-disaccharide hydrolase
MKRLMRIVVVSLLVGLAGFGCRSMSGGEGWVTLIDGNDGMDNWSVSGRAANWRAEGGAIQADKFMSEGKVASVLVSKRSFKDFELRVEFWAADDTNSGVYLRAPNPNQVNTASGAYEVQIWDKNPNPKYATGSLVNVAAVEPIYKAANKWNTFEIVAKGTQITVRMNGVVTASIQDAKNTQDGRLGVQFNGGPIKVRKLAVKPL